jgi:hypothetical protein
MLVVPLLVSAMFALVVPMAGLSSSVGWWFVVRPLKWFVVRPLNNIGKVCYRLISTLGFPTVMLFF